MQCGRRVTSSHFPHSHSFIAPSPPTPSISLNCALFPPILPQIVCCPRVFFSFQSSFHAPSPTGFQSAVLFSSHHRTITVPSPFNSRPITVRCPRISCNACHVLLFPPSHSRPFPPTSHLPPVLHSSPSQYLFIALRGYPPSSLPRPSLRPSSFPNCSSHSFSTYILSYSGVLYCQPPICA